MPFCTKCGTPMAQDARYCSNCGSFEGEPAPQHNSQVSPQQPGYQQAVNTGAAVANTAVKAAKTGGAMLKWIIALVLVVGISVFVVVQFDLLDHVKSDETLIRERIEAFEAAFNNGDWESLMECVDRSSQLALESTMNIAGGLFGGFTGIDLDFKDLFSLGGAMTSDGYYNIEVLDIVITGDTATVYALMYTNDGEYTEYEETEIPMIKEDGQWVVDLGVDMESFFGF